MVLLIDIPIFLTLAIFISTTLADNPDELWECVKGSETGDKIAEAFEFCFTPFNPETTRNDNNCYDFNTTMDWINSTYYHDYCVLSYMGWINENETGYDWDTWVSDIDGLPEDVTEAVWKRQGEWGVCWMNLTNKWGSNPCFSGGESKYSEEEKTKLEEIGAMIAQYECFKDSLMDACSEVAFAVIGECVADSATGDKIETALGTCFNVSFTETDRSLENVLKDRSSDDNDTKCYDYENTTNWLYSHYDGDICFLGKMGWLLNNGSNGFNFTTWMDDIDGLPTNTSEGILDKQDDWSGCVDYLVDLGSQDPCYNGTQSLYSDEERESLAEIGKMIAQYECFRYYFFQTCNELYGSD